MKNELNNAIADLLGIALAHATSHVGAQAAYSAAGLIGCIARHPFSSIPEDEIYEVNTGPDLCEFLEHETVQAHYRLQKYAQT